jgi:hypothetical protein
MLTVDALCFVALLRCVLINSLKLFLPFLGRDAFTVNWIFPQAYKQNLQ